MSVFIHMAKWPQFFFLTLFFRIVEYLVTIANIDKFEDCRRADKALISSVEECGGGVSYDQWKDKVTVITYLFIFEICHPK